MPRRPKPAVSAWIVQERKRLKLKPVDLARRLTAMGLTTADGTPRTWEAGRNPSPENIEGLERIFETRAPGSDAPAADHSALAVAIERQADAISELAAQVKVLAERQPTGEELSNVLAAAVALAVRETLRAAAVASEPQQP